MWSQGALGFADKSDRDPSGSLRRRLVIRVKLSDCSINKSPNGKRGRAGPTFGTNPATGKWDRPAGVFVAKKPGAPLGDRQARGVEATQFGINVYANVDKLADLGRAYVIRSLDSLE